MRNQKETKLEIQKRKKAQTKINNLIKKKKREELRAIADIKAREEQLKLEAFRKESELFPFGMVVSIPCLKPNY